MQPCKKRKLQPISSDSSSSTVTRGSLSDRDIVVRPEIPKNLDNVALERLLDTCTLEDSKDAFLPTDLTPISFDSDDEIEHNGQILPTLVKCAPPSDNTPSDDEEEQDYEVEKILLKRKDTNYYCIKWLGYNINQASWETSENLDHCEKIIKTFESRRQLCFEIYESLPNKDEYGGFLDTWINGIFTPTFIESSVLEDIFVKFCKRNGFGDFCVENWTRSVATIPDFVFLAESIFSEKAKYVLEKTDSPKHLCDCDVCDKKNQSCPCIEVFTTVNGFLRKDADVLTECHRNCKCSEKCAGKIFIRGRTIPVMLFKTTQCGWGLRTLVDIQANKFVVEYVGHIKLFQECQNAKDQRYIFDIDMEDDDETPKSTIFVIDATNEGNASRFINHSCNPNLEVKLVKGYFAQEKFAKVVFFSIGFIKAGEELTFNYFKHEPNLLEVDEETPKCHCKYEKCRKYLI